MQCIGFATCDELIVDVFNTTVVQRRDFSTALFELGEYVLKGEEGDYMLPIWNNNADQTRLVSAGFVPIPQLYTA